VQLEAARAYVEEVARRIDAGEEDLQVEGSIAKYFATEAGDAAANDAIQAFGGYGYMREYEVEKIKRDVKILTIYEGTSEIQRSIISMFRMRSTVRSKGAFYLDMAKILEGLSSECGAPPAAKALRAMNEMILAARKQKLTKNQYVMFLLADMMTCAEVADALCRKAAAYQRDGQPRSPEFINACARLFARKALQKVYVNGAKVLQGCDQTVDDLIGVLQSLDFPVSMKGYLRDMDQVASELVS
jgi:alkylation response protein AidB-like acyl-CoA dehydrogenase